MTTENIDKRVWVEQISLLHSQLPIVIISNLLTSAVVAIALRGYLNKQALAIWISLVFTIAIYRLFHWRHWKSIPITDENIGKQSLHFNLFFTLSGSLWGVFGVLTVLQNIPQVSLVTIMVLGGLVASATASLAHIRGAFLGFIIPFIIPTAIALTTLNDTLYQWVATLIVLYLIVSILFANRFRTTIIQSIMLRFENQGLVDRLTEEKGLAVQSMNMAERANKSKTQFLAAASHDLRQPLCALRLYTATLQMMKNDKKQQDVAKNIDASVTALEQLFDSLLDVSKLDAGTLQVQRENFFLRTILDRMKIEFDVVAEEKGLTFDMKTENYIVDSDQQLLETLLRNLINNAIRYTSEGGVTINTTTINDSVKIDVCDTGRGIALEDQEHIFEEFVQLNNPERDRTKGIGLGLSIVKRLSTLLDIDLKVKSELDKGSVFSLTIPKGNEVSMASQAVIPISDHKDLSALFVIVIDDEIAIQEAMSNMLEEWGCLTIAAGSADEAFEIMSEIDEQPDVAIVDLRLRGGETGLQVIDAFREAFSEPFSSLILTGDIEAGRLQEVHASGLPIMHKPCDTEALFAFLNDVSRNKKPTLLTEQLHQQQ